MRVLVLLIVSVIVVTQSLGVLVSHEHVEGLGDTGGHAHSFVVDAHGHAGHPEDLIPTDEAHSGGSDVVRMSATVVLLGLGLAVVAIAVGAGPLRTVPLGNVRRAFGSSRPQNFRLALLSILRV